MWFTTSDGYRLRREVGGTWTDGDLTFTSGPDGLPVDDTGAPLDGLLTDDDGLPISGIE